jgi:Phage gp6-like head-tail connector protein
LRLQLVTPPVFQMTGALTLGSAVVSGLSAPTLPPFAVEVFQPFVGQPVRGTGIPTGTTVIAVTGNTGVTLSQNATASGSQTLVFGVHPVTLDEVKAHAVVEFDDDDLLLYSYIHAATRYVETRLRSALITQTWVLLLDGFPSGNASYYNRAVRQIWASAGPVAGASAFGAGVIPSAAGVIDIPWPPLQQIVSLNYIDFSNQLQTIAPTVFNVSHGIPGRIQPVYSQFWPITPPTIDSVQVTFTAGYGPLEINVPESARLAIKFMVATWYQNRESIAPGQMLKVPDTVDAILSVDDPGIYA